MREYSLSQCRVLTVMEKGRLVCRAPELARQEFAVARKEARRAGPLVHVSRFGLAVVRAPSAGHSHRRLEDRKRRHIGARHLVDETVAVRIGANAEPFGRLNPVMMIECVVRKLPDRDDVTSLMKGSDYQTR